ncbi:MAG: pyrroline-5-carboxylate reductase family protein, partial [Thermomicrobiales bacterium]
MTQDVPYAPESPAEALAGARLAFIGAGVMAESMIAGLLKRGLIAPDGIIASHPRADRREKLVARFGIATAEHNAEAASGADLVFLTVKPQVLTGVMKQLKGQLQPHQVAVSIIAGAPFSLLRQGLNHEAIVRVMPNTPAQIGAGMMVWASTPEVPNDQFARVRAALGALGEELWVEDEKYVDMATALSGTGPTYVFLMMEALIDAGVHMGFPRRIAEQIV